MEPGAGINIITGETGAGKSILMGALSLILGERSDSKTLFNPEQKCVIEAVFQLDKPTFKPFFEKEELDFETQTVIRREITPNGKSRAFINDTPVNLPQLRALGEQLVNLHSQHETLELIDSGFQLKLVDHLAGTTKQAEDYEKQYAHFREAQRNLQLKLSGRSRSQQELEFLQFQLKEINEANLHAEEQQALETEQQTLSNVEDILHATKSATTILSEGETTAIDLLREAQHQLKSLARVNPTFAAISNRIESALIELKDVSSELEHLNEQTVLDPQRLEEVTFRLNTIYRLQKKYALPDNRALLEFRDQLIQKLQLLDNSDEAIAALTATVALQEKELTALAGTLHRKRTAVLPSFKKNTEKLLHKAGMPNAVFDIAISELENSQLSETGITGIEFLFSANKGFAPQPVRKVASGGELSRLMLCVKAQLAGKSGQPTLIFDEIDAGISGEVALRVGEIMLDMSKHFQLICITHLPQIARVADKHFYIYKETKSGKTSTSIAVLDQNNRINEIAKMLGGDKPGEAALANARELLTKN